MPAAVVTGARQIGKSTLASHLVPGGRRYASLDDLDVLDAARRDPEALVGGTGPVTLDEVQREPGVLRAVKQAVDRDRRPGRFLLTGSANLLLMRQVSESLAGRASYLTLWPMTRRETDALPHPSDWDTATVGKSVEVKRGVSWSKEQEHSQPGEGRVPVIGISNVQARLELRDLLYLSAVKPAVVSSSATDDRSGDRSERSAGNSVATT